jgi:hypothetical protein
MTTEMGIHLDIHQEDFSAVQQVQNLPKSVNQKIDKNRISINSQIKISTAVFIGASIIGIPILSIISGLTIAGSLTYFVSSFMEIFI